LSMNAQMTAKKIANMTNHIKSTQNMLSRGKSYASTVTS
jgi:hypothetical protein